MTLPQLLAWCRPGFEPECAQALAALDATLDGGGWARTTRDSGRVEFTSPAVPALLPRWRELVFARQALEVIASFPELPANDRLGAPLARLADDPRRWCDVWVEAADSDEGRELAGLCRALNAAAVAALRKAGLLDRDSPWRLHLALTGRAALCLAAADTRHAAPWAGGIPRLRFPRGAPSRSTLKLEEAFLVLLSESERDAWLRPGMTAVDLGAAPGGWTYQFVQRSIHVTAVDNGPMDAALLDSGLVRHRHEDGFRFRPDRPVDWLVCDMVEQPRRVAALIGQWLAEGACARAMFNLKLPMKKRWDEVQTCFALLHEAVPEGLDLRARQLYHDREEITVFAAVRAR